VFWSEALFVFHFIAKIAKETKEENQIVKKTPFANSSVFHLFSLTRLRQS
jgi:hypothetical protein